MFLVFIKQEPVAFNVTKGNEQEAKTLLKKIYKKEENFDALIDELYTKLMQSTSKDVSSVSLKDAMFHP